MAHPDSTSEIIRKADDLYGRRGKADAVLSSVELLRSIKPGTYELFWRTARALFFLGQEAKQADESRLFHRIGMAEGRRAVKSDPTRVEGHFWLGVNLALIAGLAAPWSAIVFARRSRSALNRAIEIDATYHAAGPLRVLARLEHKLPQWLGGDVAKSRARFEEAIRIAPHNTVTRIYFAELLLDLKSNDEARAHLETILSMQADPAWEFETERDWRLAKEMLSTID